MPCFVWIWKQIFNDHTSKVQLFTEFRTDILYVHDVSNLFRQPGLSRGRGAIFRDIYIYIPEMMMISLKIGPRPYIYI